MSSWLSRIDWVNKFVDLIGVFAGVTIAFALTNWQEGRKSEVLHRQYLVALQSDLRRDLVNIGNDLITLDTLAIKNAGCMAYAKGRKIPSDSIEYFLSGVMVQTVFHPNIAAFESIIAAGDLAEFTDVSFVTNLTELYHGEYANIKELDQIGLNNLQDRVIARMLEEESFEEKYLRSKSFHNLAFLIDGINQQKKRACLDAKGLAEKIIAVIDNKLNT